MFRRIPMLTGLLLAVAACSGIDNGATAPDATDLTTSAYRIPSGATIHVSPDRAEIAAGATVKLSTAVNSSNGQTLRGLAPLAVTWVSSDTTIARVSSTGVVLGRSPGSITVRAVSGTQSAESKIIVKVNSTAPISTVDTAAATPPATKVETAASEPATASAAPAATTPATTTPTTTAPTTTPPAPAATTPNPGQASLQSAVTYDDFTRYHSTADLQNAISTNIGGTGSPASALYTDGHNPQLASLDQSVTYNGHATVRYDQPAGSGNTPELWVNFKNGVTLRNFWYRVTVRYSPGWTTKGTLTNSANSYKLFDWGWAGGMNGRGGIVLTNTTQYQAYFYLLNGGSTITAPNDTPFGNVQGEWTDGQWYTYVLNYQQSTPTTATLRVWMAPTGQTPKLVATVNGNSLSSTWPAVNRIEVGENFNQIRVNAQSIWIGEWSVFDGSQYSNPYNVH